MKKPKFTPEPWYLRGGKNGMLLFIEAKPKSKMPYGLDVCGDDYNGYGDEEQREHNMRLMVKAPAMYKKLEDLILVLQCTSNHDQIIFDKLIEEIETLLAEARGEK